MSICLKVYENSLVCYGQSVNLVPERKSEQVFENDGAMW